MHPALIFFWLDPQLYLDYLKNKNRHIQEEKMDEIGDLKRDGKQLDLEIFAVVIGEIEKLNNRIWDFQITKLDVCRD